MSAAFLFPTSLIFLLLVVASVYTLSKEVDAAPAFIVKKMLYRLGQMAGLLAALALVVYFLGYL